MEYTKIKLSPKERQEIEAKLTEIMEFAQIHKLPFFFSMVMENGSEGTTYHNAVYTAQTNHLKLKDDAIRKYVLVAGGFEPVPPRESMDLNIGELLEDH